MRLIFTNNAVSLLAAPLLATDTSLTVLAGHGALFPSPAVGETFLITLENQSATIREIIEVTGRSGDTLTFSLINRGQEGTTAQNWPASLGSDTLVDHRITAGTLRWLANTYDNPLYPALTTLEEAVTQALAQSGGGGGLVVDAPFDLDPGLTTTTLTLQNTYAPNSTSVFVGGLRLKRGVDFTETTSDTLTLNFVITQAEIDEGTNIVIDFIAA